MEQVLQSGRRRGFRARLEQAGLSPRQERRFNIASTIFVVVYTATWITTVVLAVVRGEAVPMPIAMGTVAASPLSDDAPPIASFISDAVVRGMASKSGYRGISGAVLIDVHAPGDPLTLPDSLPAGTQIVYKPIGTPDTTPVHGASATAPPAQPGIFKVLLQLGNAAREIPGMSVATLVPMSEKKRGYVGQYLVGSWPFENGARPRSPAYTPPRGFIQVTPDNLGTRITEHLKLGDYLTKGQTNVWPKYVVMVPRELDKIELTMQELEREGHPVEKIGIISAFRTPNYNVEGGNPAGRAALSRHMYGDAMDIYIDNNHDGRMDDLNGDGRIDVKDARVIGHAAEQVERNNPSMVGGIGIYAPTGAHSGFVHIDTRGFRARWGPW
jgi:hypothetical protein